MAQEILSMDQLVIKSLQSFSIPVKTKNLANRLGLDSVELTKCLKVLEQKGMITYVSTKSKKDSNKLGWIIAYSKI